MKCNFKYIIIYYLSSKYICSAFDVKAYILLIANRRSDGDLKRGGKTLQLCIIVQSGSPDYLLLDEILLYTHEASDHIWEQKHLEKY